MRTRAHPAYWHRRIIKQFAQNVFVDLRVVSGELDHVLPPETKKILEEFRVAHPEEQSARLTYLANVRKEATEWQESRRNK